MLKYRNTQNKSIAEGLMNCSVAPRSHRTRKKLLIKVSMPVMTFVACTKNPIFPLHKPKSGSIRRVREEFRFCIQHYNFSAF